MLEEARKLEYEFEAVALDPERSVIAKRRDLGRILGSMLNDAAEDARHGRDYSDLRLEFVLDFVDRIDLIESLLADAFSSVTLPPEENPNYCVLMEQASAGKAMLERINLHKDMAFRLIG